MTPIPQDPAGSSGLVQTLKQVLRILREQRVLDDPTLKIERKSNGTRIAVRPGKGGGGAKDDLVWL